MVKFLHHQKTTIQKHTEMNIQDLLNSSEPILLDGAMGSMLMAQGIDSDTHGEVWNVEQPERVAAVHRHYIESGSQIVLTNSFSGNRLQLRARDLEERTHELNKAAAKVLRAEIDASGKDVLAAGSMGPSGELLEPFGELTIDQAKETFAEQAAALTEGGVDLLWIETFSDLNEIKAAIEGVQSASDLPIIATMTFDTHGHTMMGIKPEQMVAELKEYGLVAMGGNCGNGPDEIIAVVKAMHAADPDLTIVAKSNAGLPHIVDNKVVYDGTPEIMAEYAKEVQAAGAHFIGACCGSTPDHIHAMSTSLK
ncbi:MAG: methionine synthase [Chloroflexi bacterium]|nr:MAG: methionine synthase [Chloroflexota bacterium]